MGAPERGASPRHQHTPPSAASGAAQLGLPRCLATGGARRGAEVRAAPRRAGPSRRRGCPAAGPPGSRCEGRSGVSRGSLRAGRARGAEEGCVCGIASACGAAHRSQRPIGVGTARPAALRPGWGLRRMPHRQGYVLLSYKPFCPLRNYARLII